VGSSSNEISSSLGGSGLPTPRPSFDGTGAFVFPDALRAVVLDAGLAAALDAAGFFSKKSVMEAWVVGFVFLAGFMYASLSSSSLSVLVWEENDYDYGR
jgi:hypothetical protein